MVLNTLEAPDMIADPPALFAARALKLARDKFPLLECEQTGEFQMLPPQHPVITNEYAGDGAHQTGITDEPGEDIIAHGAHELPRHHQNADDRRDQSSDHIRNHSWVQIRKVI